MVFPIIPLLALAAVLGGGTALVWYSSLDKGQQREADRIAAGYALDLYGKGLEALSAAQAKHVHAITKRHFTG